MLKILYIVGTGSKYSDIELRWSLRSVERFAQCDVQPVVVGSVPDWFKGDALPCPDKFERKEKNLNHKIMAAIGAKLVEGEFQISADDHFWIKPTDFRNLPIYFRELALPNFLVENNNYNKALYGTLRIMLESGYSVINTTCHCNAWADSRSALNAEAVFENAKDEHGMAEEYGVVAWALWPNLHICTGEHLTRPIRWRKDLKYRGEAGFLDFIRDAEMFSINDSAFGSMEFISFMKENFGNESRWEK